MEWQRRRSQIQWHQTTGVLGLYDKRFARTRILLFIIRLNQPAIDHHRSSLSHILVLWPKNMSPTGFSHAGFITPRPSSIPSIRARHAPLCSKKKHVPTTHTGRPLPVPSVTDCSVQACERFTPIQLASLAWNRPTTLCFFLFFV